MKILILVLAVFMLSGCATSYYVGQGQEQSFKSMEECRLAHPNDQQYCVDRAQYTAASQNTIMLILQGIGTAALAALTIFAIAQ